MVYMCEFIQFKMLHNPRLLLSVDNCLTPNVVELQWSQFYIETPETTSGSKWIVSTWLLLAYEGSYSEIERMLVLKLLCSNNKVFRCILSK